MIDSSTLVYISTDSIFLIGLKRNYLSGENRKVAEGLSEQV